MADAQTQADELSRVIRACLDLQEPRSFFLYAGAGTGKTRAVIEAMELLRTRYGPQFRQSGRRVAVITYTNAACDEIRRRIDFDPIFFVSTVHSFAWEQIRTYHKDIAVWLRQHLRDEVGELQEKQRKGKAGTKSFDQRLRKIRSKRERLAHLDSVRQFSYNPNGENIGKNALNHAEVLALFSAFLSSKSLMQQILIRKHPFLLVDESQDTQRDVIDALFLLQKARRDEFSLSLFGDTMQRIYADGKVGLERAVPEDWEKPALTVNYRCPRRVVALLNEVRAGADGAQQEPRNDAAEGLVRLFLVDGLDDADTQKAELEDQAAEIMAEVTSDEKWLDHQATKVLTLEHHMAARRGGFDGFFEPLYAIDRFKTRLLDGTLSGIAFFSQQVLPLIAALQNDDEFAVARIVKEFCPLLSADALKANSDLVGCLDNVRVAVEAVSDLLAEYNDPVLLDIVRVINDESLFSIPEAFLPALSHGSPPEGAPGAGAADVEDDVDYSMDAWHAALSVPLNQLCAYAEYIADRSRFGTHQGVKGLQFPRVMVIMDDNEARGFMFSYEKLLGAKERSETDKRNEREGRDSCLDRTRRLFYVTCSRAQQSLAVVVYTNERDMVAERMAERGWFEDDEIVRL